VNNSYGIFRAVSSGLGVAALADYIAAENPALVRILPELTGPPIEAYFVYPEELRASKRIAVFRDFLIRNVNEARGASGSGAARPRHGEVGRRAARDGVQADQHRGDHDDGERHALPQGRALLEVGRAEDRLGGDLHRRRGGALAFRALDADLPSLLALRRAQP